MINGKSVTAIITAAGKGSRMGTSLPKQFLSMGGKTILARAIEPFEEAEFVDRILVVTNRDFVALCEKICEDYSKVERVLVGGKERQDSVKNALDIIEDGYALIHDGARPYVSEDIIKAVLTDAAETGASVAAVPVKDTIRQAEDAGSKTLPRETLYSVQTPQGFEVGLIKEAFAKAYAEGFYGTDDAGLVDRMGHPVAISQGSYGNIKITTKEDLPVEMRIGHGYDVHRLVEGRELILCGVNIPFEKGLLGHSDADVAIHALMDSLLGAAGMRDIGNLFPDNDDSYKGISSVLLLEEVTKRLKEQGWSLNNADVTIMAQRPKLAPHIDIMRENMAKALGASVDVINVKATTTEKLGFVGREEGIAAEAVCILSRG
ncbi:MAG: 2-C-methyl-D-erythritol 2,4-cyclodiphosphate synthase [Firmicutes bacterium]|nr:2-C-methyl-D-erythritol 2,4-cyclodiphosphate synthase [Bacillota bacterium]